MIPSVDLRARIEQWKTQSIWDYPNTWERMISGWRAPGDDRAWLMYAANYLFRTGNMRWAIDPVTLHQRVPGAAQPDVLSDLDKLDFVLLTHQHADHLDLNLLHKLRSLPVKWVVPEPLLEMVGETGIPQNQIIVPRAGVWLQLYVTKILPFHGLHWEKTDGSKPTESRGVPAIGYLVEFSDKRWLFPGDTRGYQTELLPSFGQLDAVFAHLWLGRGCARMEAPPLLEGFCRFFTHFQTGRLVVTHLHEFGRDADDYWHERHYQKVFHRCQEIAPQLQVSCAVMGESLAL